ncbi:hypothetical protein ACNHKD_12890 [Methylocystis sp. JAN1]|uniref:hypothetical protein n=1 Tax=Methylocystis sp. JAN1 TaxID=3397211 RepID=UPI003FA2CBC8
MAETTEDLKTKLTELVERRVELAYQLAGAYDDKGLTTLAAIHSAIAALEAVIASGAGEPEASCPEIHII